MAINLIRYTGTAPINESAITGRGKRWWPGEMRAVTATIAAQLLAARKGFEVERVADAADLLVVDPESSAGGNSFSAAQLAAVQALTTLGNGLYIDAPLMAAPTTMLNPLSMSRAWYIAFGDRQWKLNRVRKGYGWKYTASTGTIIYVDPAATATGSGTLASPYNQAQFVSDAFTVAAGTTVLIKEGTTYYAGTGIQSAKLNSNCVWGTYDKTTGQRVLSFDRLATVSWSGGAYGMLLPNGKSISNVTVSGIRFTCPDVRPGDRRAVYAQISASNSTLVVEYCFFDGLDSRLSAGGVVPGGGVFSFWNNTTVRFCKFRSVYGDSIWIGDSNSTGSYIGGENPVIVGNDIEIPADLDNDGPDGCQLANYHGMGTLTIQANKIVCNVNAKQCLIANGYGTGINLTSGDVSLNVLVGHDLSLQLLGANNNKSVEWDFPNVNFHGNIVIDAQYGINLGSNADGCSILGNIFVATASAMADASLNQYNSYYGVVVGNGANNCVVAHNLLICTAAHIGGNGVQAKGASSTGSVVRDNIFMGGFFRATNVDNGTSEVRNVFFRAINNRMNASDVSQAIGTGSVDGDPLLAGDLSPMPLSPALTTSSTLTTPFFDVYGTAADGAALLRGCVQSLSITELG